MSNTLTLSASRIRLATAFARRAARRMPSRCGARLREPVFVVGFNNSGKSTITRAFAKTPGVALYPEEGNGDLWFPGMFPWSQSDVALPPIWHSPERFVAEALRRQSGSFPHPKAVLGAFQLAAGRRVVNDSGMLAALVPQLAVAIPDAKFVHVVRNGVAASYVTARIEWARMLRDPRRYAEQGCALDFLSTLTRMASYWSWTEQGVRALAASQPERVLRLGFDDIRQRRSTVIERTLHFLDLEPRPDLPVDAATPDVLSTVVDQELTPAERTALVQVLGEAEVAALADPD